MPLRMPALTVISGSSVTPRPPSTICTQGRQAGGLDLRRRSGARARRTPRSRGRAGSGLPPAARCRAARDRSARPPARAAQRVVRARDEPELVLEQLAHQRGRRCRTGSASRATSSCRRVEALEQPLRSGPRAGTGAAAGRPRAGCGRTRGSRNGAMVGMTPSRNGAGQRLAARAWAVIDEVLRLRRAACARARPPPRPAGVSADRGACRARPAGTPQHALELLDAGRKRRLGDEQRLGRLRES